jgi:hypothetical protein
LVADAERASEPFEIFVCALMRHAEDISELLLLSFRVFGHGEPLVT